jgi:hypothetical protein
MIKQRVSGISTRTSQSVHPCEDLVEGATISADGRLLVTGCMDGNAYIWDIQIILTEAGIEDMLCTPNVSVHL